MQQTGKECGVSCNKGLDRLWGLHVLAVTHRDHAVELKMLRKEIFQRCRWRLPGKLKQYVAKGHGRIWCLGATQHLALLMQKYVLRYSGSHSIQKCPLFACKPRAWLFSAPKMPLSLKAIKWGFYGRPSRLHRRACSVLDFVYVSLFVPCLWHCLTASPANSICDAI